MKFYPLNIKALQKIIPDAVEVTFTIPDDLRDTFTFLPGQYLTIAPTIAEETPRRAYSICSEATQKDISILIKKIDGGKVSSYMNDVVTVNKRLLVAPPNGHFKLNHNTVQSTDNYIFIGAGSGITPLISMITTLLKTTKDTSCHLYYGSRTSDTIIYKSKLDRLKLVYKERLQIHHFISRGDKTNSSTGKHGIHFQNSRVDPEVVVNKINQLDSKYLAGIYLCGPAELIESSISKIESAGVSKEKIHREYFTAPISDASTIEMDFEELPQRTVKVELEGQAIDITINDEKDILRQLMADGYEPPYSCLQGTCSTCKAKLISGEVKMKVDIGLEADEIEEGYILTCQSIPLTKNTHCKFEN